MVTCCAPGCSNRSDRKERRTSNGTNLSFHRFPTDESLRDEWIACLKRTNWAPANRSALCSSHFKESCYDPGSPNVRRLKKDALPTIFPALPFYHQQTSMKRPSRKRKLEEDIPEDPLVTTSGTVENSDESQDSTDVAL